jgi:hypothetical protein
MIIVTANVGLLPFEIGKVARHSMHVHEIHPRKDHRGADLVSDVLPFSRLCYGGPNAINNTIEYTEHYSRSHDAVIAFTTRPAT